MASGSVCRGSPALLAEVVSPDGARAALGAEVRGPIGTRRPARACRGGEEPDLLASPDDESELGDTDDEGEVHTPSRLPGIRVVLHEEGERANAERQHADRCHHLEQESWPGPCDSRNLHAEEVVHGDRTGDGESNQARQPAPVAHMPGVVDRTWRDGDVAEAAEAEIAEGFGVEPLPRGKAQEEHDDTSHHDPFVAAADAPAEAGLFR